MVIRWGSWVWWCPKFCICDSGIMCMYNSFSIINHDFVTIAHNFCWGAFLCALFIFFFLSHYLHLILLKISFWLLLFSLSSFLAFTNASLTTWIVSRCLFRSWTSCVLALSKHFENICWYNVSILGFIQYTLWKSNKPFTSSSNVFVKLAYGNNTSLISITLRSFDNFFTIVFTIPLYLSTTAF